MAVNQPTVRAVRCAHTASDQEIYASLQRATAPLNRAWDRLKQAKRIGIKFNQAWSPSRLVTHRGHLQELVSYQVARATLRLLRERTTAELVCSEISVVGRGEGLAPIETMTLLPLLQEFDVSLCEGNEGPFEVYPVPGGGQMFGRYLLPKPAAGVDAFVSVQKLKNHAFMGITLCLKNLFGLVPEQHVNRPRQYFHHLVRMPYMLADLGRIFDPALNIIDGLVGQAGREWGGSPVVGDALIAGDQIIATDACGAHLMGHDPHSDWLTPPFHRDRNALLAAAEGGFGTVDLARIDFASEVSAPVGAFYAQHTDDRARVLSWRRTTCEQALIYRDRRAEYVSRYPNEYILLQDGKVVWHSPDGSIRASRRELSGNKPDQAMWLKYVDPDETEEEHFEVYERALAALPNLEMA